MTLKFKPIEVIVNDSAVRKGDLIFLRKREPLVDNETRVTTIPVIYAGEDTYVSNGQDCGFSAGRKVSGIRVHDNLAGGLVNPGNTVLDDKQKGALIPFNHNPLGEDYDTSAPDFSWDQLKTHEYAFVAPAKDLVEE